MRELLKAGYLSTYTVILEWTKPITISAQCNVLFIRSCNLISYFWMLFLTFGLCVLLLHCRFRRAVFVVLPGKSFKWLFWGSFYQLYEDKSKVLLNRLQQCRDTFRIQRCPEAVFNFKHLSRSHRKMMCWSVWFYLVNKGVWCHLRWPERFKWVWHIWQRAYRRHVLLWTHRWTSGRIS